jgi:hypothetical protein
VTPSLRVYFVKWCQTTHQQVCYVLLSRSTCRISIDHSWKSVVCKGKTKAFHTLDIVLKTRHTQCGIFLHAFSFYRFWQSRLSVYADCWLLLLFGSHDMLQAPSADRHYLQWHIIGGTWALHRVGALNLNSNSVLSKGHRPGWSKATLKDMWYKCNM